jgi:sec-independent protein translocase protein TatC
MSSAPRLNTASRSPWLWKPFAESWRAAGVAGDPLNCGAERHLPTPAIADQRALIAAPGSSTSSGPRVAPGLYKKKKIVIPFVFFSTVLFVGGGLFGWRIAFPVTFKYFLDLAGTDPSNGIIIRPVVMVPEYLDFVNQMLLGFGIVFELPLFILFLSIAGVVNYLQLIRFGRWFILVAFTVGAILTPPDTTSQLVMSIPLCLLYFVSIGLAYLFGKRPSKEQIERARAERQAKRLAKSREREAKRRAKKKDE